jgi:effector-binding domain-containing protein
MSHAVSLQVALPRAIAAVGVQLPIDRVSETFPKYLNQVYAAARDGVLQLDGQNIFVYRNAAGSANEVDIEFGVGVSAPFSPIGSVQYSHLPVGEVATTTHWGDYARLGEAHAAVLAWCRANERALAGPRWEIYGHWSDDVPARRTDVYYLLQPAT